ncbi:MAG: thiamine-phosphate kinase [Prevotellaceae bacterium]|jgi:thiamine-monophosphate kinase|nr:thiamine-phosphate kinase [Prevotellaceae bacterium]
MNIGEIGEFGLIEKLTKDIALKNPTTVKGVGDDAAVIAAHMEETLVSTDMLLEGVHFDLTYTPLKHLGCKAAMVNFSDIYAMNGYPRQMLVAIGISKRFTVEQVEEIYEGMRFACDLHGVDLVGGDTTASLTGLTICITVVGACEPDKVVYRSGAKPADLICVSGNLGAAYMGLLLLEREKQVFEAGGKSPQLEGHDYIVGRFLKPEARKDIVDSLREAEIVPTSMIDISDGLSSEVLHLCKQSNVGARLFLDKIPVARDTNRMAEELNMNPMTAAFNGGEDYELLFTIPLPLHDKVKDLGKVDIIGHIVEPGQGAYIIPPDGEPIKLQAQGFVHGK